MFPLISGFVLYLILQAFTKQNAINIISQINNTAVRKLFVLDRNTAQIEILISNSNTRSHLTMS